MPYIFVFGNTPDLSALELSAIYKDGDPLEIASKLGGTVKIAKELGSFSSEAELIEKITAHLTSLKLPKIDFGVSGYAGIVKTVKRHLEDVGIKARFVLPREGNDLSSVVVTKQKLIEIIVEANSDNSGQFGQTIWVQDFEEWNNRDYGRPAVDPHAGMLPPKIARMMVNIAGGSSLLDPFCGVGTVLAEGLMVGRHVFGSDVSTAQVGRTKKNLEWLNKHPFKLFESDARNISAKLTEKVDVVVTEPDLGPNNEHHLRSNMGNLREKLGYLYISALTDWQKFLKPGGRVVMVIPTFTISKDKELDLVKMVLDRAKIMGYSEFHEPIAYHRPQAIVKRNICFLTNGTH